MAAAGMVGTVVLVMMAAAHIGIIGQLPCQISRDRLISAAGHTAEQLDSGCIQRHTGTAAD